MRLLTLLRLGLLEFRLFSADGGVNSTAARPDVAVEWPEGEFPEQGGGSHATLLTGIDSFLIPANVAPLWHDLVIEDSRQYLPGPNGTGVPNPTFKQKVKRRQLKFDRNSPLIVTGGKYDGQPMTANWSTNPRPRPWSKREDPKTPWISDV